jgi:hypothetical protein
MNTGHYLKGLAMYEQPDGADFAAGKMYRTAWKQQIVDFDPAFVRFLNWNADLGAMRFSDRATPINTPFANVGMRTAGQLPYAPATVSARSQYTVAAVQAISAAIIAARWQMQAGGDIPSTLIWIG